MQVRIYRVLRQDIAGGLGAWVTQRSRYESDAQTGLIGQGIGF